MLTIFFNNRKWGRLGIKIFLFLLLSIQEVPARGQVAQNNFYLNNEIRFERLAIENGLANNIAFGMMQDKKGFMWFATLDALIKYDGYTLTRYQNNPQDTNSLGDNIVMSVFEDHTGLIWVGTAGGGGVNSFDPLTEKWKRYPHNPKLANSMGKGSIEGITEDRNGMLWFGSTDGLTRYNPKTDLFTVFINDPGNKHSLSNNRVFSIVEDKAGKLWIGTDAGVNLFDPEGEHFSLVSGDFKDSSLMKNVNIHHIYKDKNGLLWLSSFGNGVFVIDPNTKKCIAHYNHDPKNPKSIGSGVVFAITQDLSGNYWVSTEGGLYQFNQQTKFFTLNENKSYLPKTETKGHTIMTDHAGLIWLGTIGRGVIYFSPHTRKFRRYLNDEASLQFGLGTNRIKSIFKSVDNQLYVATSQNLLRFNQSSDKFEEVCQLRNLKKKDNAFIVLTAACEEKSGIFWLGTNNAGIIRYDNNNGKATFLQNKSTDSTSLANNWVNILYKDRSGKLWVGTEGGELQWYDATTKKFIRYRYLGANEEAPPTVGIRFIYEDSKGDLWLGIRAFHLGLGGNGLYHINQSTGNIKQYKHLSAEPNSLSNNSVTCLHEDRQGLFWIGTYGGGLNQLDATTGKITVYTKENGLLSNTVQGIESDSKDNLWLMADEGITRLNSITSTAKQFGLAHGLATSPLGVESEDYNAYLSIQNNDGTIFFSSNNGYNGLVAFKPASVQENNFKPSVALTQIKVFDKSYPVTDKEISLPYNQNFLDFEFASLSYLSSGKNQYAYKLDGVDNEWVNNGTRRTARYTKVPPGKYTFHVRGSNNDGVWNEQAAFITIIIHPPWWKTWWAYTLYALLIVSSIWSFVHYRSRSLVKQKRLLETQVVERTAEVEHQKQELQNTLENLKSTQAQLIQSEKMASLGELTAGIAHEIQNPLNFVNNFSEVSEEMIVEAISNRHEAGEISPLVTELLTDIKQNLEKINHHGKRAEVIIKGMLEHSRSRSAIKEPTDINKLVEEYLRLSYQGILAKDKAFAVVLKTEYDEALFAGEKGMGKINVIPADIGRVILNTVNNAFYAVNQKVNEEKIRLQETENNIDKPWIDSVSVKYKPEVSISTKKSGGRVYITVKDNGNGIPDNIISKIFQPFFTTKPTGSGTGLGLSLSYDIIKAHGGEIKVESIPGEGVVLIISIPSNA